jgi:hypothetical protein
VVFVILSENDIGIAIAILKIHVGVVIDGTSRQEINIMSSFPRLRSWE